MPLSPPQSSLIKQRSSLASCNMSGGMVNSNNNTTVKAYNSGANLIDEERLSTQQFMINDELRQNSHL